jgi:hypothetical protein
MIGVLSQDHDLYVIEMGSVECIEDKTSRGVDRLAGHFFRLEMGSDLEEIGLVKFLFKHLFPGSFDFYVHAWMFKGPKIGQSPQTS